MIALITITAAVVTFGCTVSDSEAQLVVRRPKFNWQPDRSRQTEINRSFAVLSSKILDDYWRSFSGASYQCYGTYRDVSLRVNKRLGGTCFVSRRNGQAMCRVASRRYRFDEPDVKNQCWPFIKYAVESYERDQNQRRNTVKTTLRAHKQTYKPRVTTLKPVVRTTPKAYKPTYKPRGTPRTPAVAAAPRSCTFFGSDIFIDSDDSVCKPPDLRGKCNGGGKCIYDDEAFPDTFGQCRGGSFAYCVPPGGESASEIIGVCGNKNGRNMCIASEKLFGVSPHC